MPLGLGKQRIDTVICYLFARDFIFNSGSLTSTVDFKSQNPQLGSYFRNLNLREKNPNQQTKKTKTHKQNRCS